MHFNTKYIFKGDTESEIIGKINYNFDQILSFAIGPDGHRGPIGSTGIFGPAGRRGATGTDGIRASNWYKQPTEPSVGINSNDVWIDNSVSDGDIKVFDGVAWNNSGYRFLNSQYFKSYPYILGPGGSTDKNAIGFKNPGGITAASAISLVINDSLLTSTTSNPNNSKVLVSTDDQIDTPIMVFSKNGAISVDVPSFYWNSIGNNPGLKFDSGGSFYLTTNDDFVIDSGLARTLITSEYCNFKSNQGKIGILGDGDFSFSTNVSIGGGSFINISTTNLMVDNGSFNANGVGVTITSPLTSTYLLNSSPSSPAYGNGISVNVNPGVNKALDFNDYTGNPVLHTKPFGSSGRFGQTVFGSTGGLTGGASGPFSYHVKKVTELRKPTTTLTARKYLTQSGNSTLVDVFDASANNNWETDNIIVTTSAYGGSSDNSINSYKVGQIDWDFNFVPTFNIFGTGFKNGLSGSNDPYSAVVNDFCTFLDGSRIFVGNFKYYNEQIVKTTGSLTNILGICKVNSDGTMNTTFANNISSIEVLNATSINGIILDEPNDRVYIYGSFTLKIGAFMKFGIMCIDSNGNLEPYFTGNMTGIDTGEEIYKAVFDGTYIYAVGNFTRYYDLSGNYYRNKIVKIDASNTTSTRGKAVSTFTGGLVTATSSGPGFVNIGTSINTPYCISITGANTLIIGGSFTNYRTTTSANASAINVVELSITTGAKISTSAQFTSMTPQNVSTYVTDPVVSAIKYNPNDGKIYMGGSFIAINGISYRKIARFTIDGSHNLVLDTSFTVGTGFNDIVNDFDFDSYGLFPNRIYIGGRFTTYNGTTTPGFVALNLSGSIDTSASIYHNVVSPGTYYGIYQYTIGLVKKISLYKDPDTLENKFFYMGGFLNSTYSSGSGGGVYIKVPSSIATSYAPVYTDGTATTYRVFLNDVANDPTVHFIKGIVFDTGLPNTLTSYVDFSTSGCQYVDLIWVSKSSTGNILPRLFYKNCQGNSGYVDFDSRGVYSSATPTLNTGQSVTVTWQLNKQQTGSCVIYKNGTGTSNIFINRTISGNGTLPYSVGDKIYAVVNAGANINGYVGIRCFLVIRRTSLATGVVTSVFSNASFSIGGSVNNFSNPITIEAGYTYSINCTTVSKIS